MRRITSLEPVGRCNWEASWVTFPSSTKRQDQAYIPRLLADGGGGSPPLTDLEEDLSSCLNLVHGEHA